MSDDLVKRLRDGLRQYKLMWYDRIEAADRIEELEAKLATCEKYRDAYAEFDRIGTQAVRELEAKLAKALLIIEAYGDDEGYIPKRVVHLWNELIGGKDE